VYFIVQAPVYFVLDKMHRKQKSGSRLLIGLMFSLKAERASRAILDLYYLAGRVQGASHGAGAIFFIAPLREGWAKQRFVNTLALSSR
jgi:hypothetical protein